MRFVRDPAGFVAADLGAKLPGRGAWVAARREAIETAARKNLFARSFKGDATLPPGTTPSAFAAEIEAGIAGRALGALGLARRAGAVISGFEKVDAALKGGRVGILLTARDASADGAGKLIRLAGAAKIVSAFLCAEQSRALGEDAAVYAAVKCGPHAERFLREIERLAGFRKVYADAPHG